MKFKNATHEEKVKQMMLDKFPLDNSILKHEPMQYDFYPQTYVECEFMWLQVNQ